MSCRPILSSVAAALFAVTACPGQDKPPVALDDTAVLARACNQFGEGLHRELAQGSQGICSPTSVAIALLMLLPGARGATADEIRGMLHLPEDLNGDRLAAAATKLLTTLRSGEDAAKEKATSFRLVNDLWVQKAFPIEPGYVATLRTAFGAAATNLDFFGDTEGSRGAINAHVAKITSDRIPELLAPGLIVRDTRVVLTNAMWLRGSWQHPFPEHATRNAAFHRADGTAVDVPTMSLVERLAYAETDAWQALSLAFADGRIVCDLLLPAKGKSLSDTEAALLAGQHVAALAPVDVRVLLPKFTVGAAHRLREPLRALGMRLAFTSKGDLSGIAKGEMLLVDEVVHQTWVAVDEQGAEAAAATAVLLKRGGARRQDPVKEFRADRPFAFTLRDVRTGLVLFVGRVEDPKRAAS